VHELEFHEPNIPILDNVTRTLLMKISRNLIVHGEDTARKSVSVLGIQKHSGGTPPSYLGWYQRQQAGIFARMVGDRLDKRVYLFFGYLKPYKVSRFDCCIP